MAELRNYRVFKDEPDREFVEFVLRHIRETGQPELLPDLYYGPIDKAEKFVKLAAVHINQRKRPDRDYATCPMCKHSDKFLVGRLCWFSDRHFVAVIGQDCADKKNSEAAERAYEAKQQQRLDSDFLLEEFPLTSAKISALRQLMPAAEAALQIQQKLRSHGGSCRDILYRARRAGQLAVDEKTDARLSDIGPRAFGSTKERQTVTRSWGPVRGIPLLKREFNPIEKLNGAISSILPFRIEGEEAAFEAIAAMTDVQRRGYVMCLQQAASTFHAVKAELIEAAAFFSADHLARINAWGAHPDNPDRLEIRSDRSLGILRFVLSSRKSSVALVPSPDLWQLSEWPTKN